LVENALGRSPDSSLKPEFPMSYDPLDPRKDPLGPPAIPTEVGCLHCGQEYESYLIEWRVDTDAHGKSHGFWCCPTPGCGGCGFGFDILPLDPDYQDERGGWVSFDDEDELAGDVLGEEPGRTNGEARDALPPLEGDEDLPF